MSAITLRLSATENKSNVVLTVLIIKIKRMQLYVLSINLKQHKLLQFFFTTNEYNDGEATENRTGAKFHMK